MQDGLISGSEAKLHMRSLVEGFTKDAQKSLLDGNKDFDTTIEKMMSVINNINDDDEIDVGAHEGMTKFEAWAEEVQSMLKD